MRIENGKALVTKPREWVVDSDGSRIMSGGKIGRNG